MELKIKGISAWIKWAISQKKTVYFLVLAMVAIGFVGLYKMNKDEFPTFAIKQGLVVGVYPGATADQVELQLTKPLEETIFSYKEVNRSATTSITKDGMCYIYVDLNCKMAQKDEVWAKIKLGLQARKQTLPTGVLAVAVLDEFSSVASMLISVESSDKGYTELEEYADELCDRLRALPKLAKVSVVGGQSEEIAVSIDREKLSGYGIDPTSLMLDYQSSSLNVPAGTFKTDYANSSIRVGDGVGSEREIAEKIVWSDPSGGIVRLKDIATISRRYKDPSSFVSYNGKPCLVLALEMRPDNNIVAFGKEVDEVMAAFSQTLPDSVTLTRISDQPKVVNRSIMSFLRDLLISILVVILVMIMMFPLKSALIASSGVPVCTAVAIAVMYFAKINLDTVTLAALMTCLGMIVDDSIITMDGYMDKLSRGMSKMEAAMASAKELFMPTFIATLSICVMFFPMLGIITGYLGEFISMFPWVITIALMMSLFYAVTVVPSLEVKYITQEDPTKKKNIIARAQDWFFRQLQNIFEKAQCFSFKLPWLTMALGGVAIALGIFFFTRLNIQMMPMAVRPYFAVEMEVEGDKGLDFTRERADSLEKLFLADKRVSSVTSFVGTGAPRFTATYPPKQPSPSFTQMIVNCSSTYACESAIRDFENKYEHVFPDAIIRIKQMDYQGTEAPIVITFKGDDREALIDAADSVRKFMTSLSSDLKWVHSDCDNFHPSVEVSLDKDEAARLGVNRSLLSLSLAGTFNGQSIATLWEGDRSIPVNIYSEGLSSDMPYSAIGDQLVPTSLPGVSVPLRQVASIAPGWSLTQLDRADGRPAVNVYADMKFGKSQPAAIKQIRRYIDDNVRANLPEGATISYGGLSATNETVAPEIALSFFAAVFVFFIFLLLHFRKTSLALLTIAMSMLCLFGAFLGLWIFGLDFGITAVLGLISLVGIIVRNGILMFEYAEDARFKMGLDVKTAAMEAGKRRMRPIFLTSCTTALGVLPMVISGDLLWMPMGVVICFGTLLTIFLLVLIMPISYWLLFRKKEVAK